MYYDRCEVVCTDRQVYVRYDRIYADSDSGDSDVTVTVRRDIIGPLSSYLCQIRIRENSLRLCMYVRYDMI